MKHFSAILFVTMIGAQFSEILGASTGGWGSGPPQPQLNITLNSSFLVTTLGEVGSASANQQLVEQASGNSDTSAYILSSSGVQAELSQDGGLQEIAVANPAEENSATLNEVVVQQTVAASADNVDAYLTGANSASIEHSGETSGFGGGVIVVEGTTSNNMVNSDSSKHVR